MGEIPAGVPAHLVEAAQAALDWDGPRLDPQTVNALLMRKVLQELSGLAWEVPAPYGPDGWKIRSPWHVVIASGAAVGRQEWIHASMRGRVALSGQDNRLPDYTELTWLHRAVFGDGYAYQMFVPQASHVSINDHVLHLWGRADGQPMMPDFGRLSGGTI